MAWLTDWFKRKAITITGTTDGAQTDYQLNITVTYDSNMQADFDDIRFTLADGSTLIDHWLESKTDSTTASFWVEVPSIPANPDTIDIYLYYGNGGASSASNGTNTFPDYIYNHTEVDPGGVATLTENKINIVNEKINATYFYKEIAATGNFTCNFEYYRATGVSLYGVQCPFILGDGFGSINGTTWGTKNGIGILCNSNPHRFNISKWVSGTWGLGTSIGYSENTLYYITLSRVGTVLTLSVFSDANRTQHIAGSPRTLTVVNTAFNYSNLAITDIGYDYTRSYYVQNQFMKQYVVSEPTYETGTEESTAATRTYTIDVLLKKLNINRAYVIDCILARNTTFKPSITHKVRILISKICKTEVKNAKSKSESINVRCTQN